MEKVSLRGHLKILDEYADKYDVDIRLLKIISPTPKYHTKLESVLLHPTRESLEYALALLDGGRSEDAERAKEIVEKVLTLQDDNPESKSYGIWPYFDEEPLSEMSFPDHNWADFCGKVLLQILLDHETQVGNVLAERIKQACRHAVKSIMKRNIESYYSNVAVMGICVTLLAGKVLDDKEMTDYGKTKLKKLEAFTVSLGDFYEYNSPCYTMVLIRDLGLVRAYIKDGEILDMTESLYKLAWHCVAEHFHPQTGQWAGPNSRNYNDFLNDVQLTEFEYDLGNTTVLTEQKEFRILSLRNRLSPCPEAYHKLFSDKPEKYVIRKMNSRGFNYPFFAFVQIATTYMTKAYALGSFNRSEMWNQIRPLIAHFGDKKNPKCFRVRCLHDGYDYSSAQLHCVQYEGNIMGHIIFATDRGDTHVAFDTISDATIKAKDLRIRFQLEGAVSGVLCSASEDGHGIFMKTEEVNISLSVPYFSFGDSGVYCELKRLENLISFDVVLYNGEEKDIDFSKIKEACTVFLISLSESEPNISDFKMKKDAETLLTSCIADDTELEISTCVKPSKFCRLMLTDRQYINGKRIEEKANE